MGRDAFTEEHLSSLQTLEGHQNASFATLVESGHIASASPADIATHAAVLDGCAWKVTGGGSAGGLLVRKGKELKSSEESDRLCSGAIVEELELKGERLHYRLLQGAGPKNGWVSTHMKGKALLTKHWAGRIWIYCTGTRGDVQPFLALGVGLMKLGYKVRFFGPDNMMNSFGVISSGELPSTSNGMDWKDFLEFLEKEPNGQNNEEFLKEFHTAFKIYTGDQQYDEFFGFSTGFKEIAWTMVNNISMWAEKVLKANVNMLDELVASERPDIFIYNHLSPTVGYLMFKKYGVKSIAAHLGIEFDTVPSGRDLFGYAFWSAIDHVVVGPTSGCFPIGDMYPAEFAELYTTPERLLGVPSLYRQIMDESKFPPSVKDWSYSGWWTMDMQSTLVGDDAFGGKETLQQLKDFLKDGDDPPVCVTFGSMPMPDAAWSKICSALTSLKKRAIIISGWSGISPERLEATIEGPEFEQGIAQIPSKGMRDFIVGSMKNMVKNMKNPKKTLFIEKASHEWLFPQCCVTMHHGGAGTTSAAMRAGVPTVIFPFLVEDQYVHSAWINRLGVGVGLGVGNDPNPDIPSLMNPPFVERYLMDAMGDEVLTGLRKVCSDKDKSISSRAKEVGDIVRTENGIEHSAARIGAIMSTMRKDARSGKKREELEKMQKLWDLRRKEWEEHFEKQG